MAVDRHPSGAIATSDPRATEEGAAVLRAGGNAMDAAVAAALVLMVVEPHACGLGGDAFVVIHSDGMNVAFDGSGATPEGLAAAAADPSFTDVGFYEGRSVTPPGAIRLLADALDTWGSRDLAELLAAPITLAGDGYFVTDALAGACSDGAAGLERDPVLGPLFVPGGRPRAAGETIVNPQLARALQLIAKEGPDVLYRGELASSIVETVRARDGFLTASDLEAHWTTDIALASFDFCGSTVWELGPPTQGPGVLAALAALDQVDLGDDREVVRACIEGLASVGVDLLNMKPIKSPPRDTTYIAAMDPTGLTVSLITSIFTPFGSFIGDAGIGGSLQNRAAGYTAIGERPRRGKPPHTTIPAMVTTGDHVDFALGVVGGYMQAQGQVQLLVNVLGRDMGLHDAIAAPRFRVLAGGDIALEHGHALSGVYPEAVGRSPGLGGFGGAQAAGFGADGATVAVADPRRGGLAIVLD